MFRAMLFVAGGLVGALLAVRGSADEPGKLTPEERAELETRWQELWSTAGKAFQAGKLADAEKPCREALEIARRLYPVDEFPNGHPFLAGSLNNMALVYRAQGKLAGAEVLLRAAIDVHKRLFKGDRTDLAQSLGNLGVLCTEQGKLTEAESLCTEALEMHRRLNKGDDRYVANSMANLAGVYQFRGKLTDAEVLAREALALTRRRFKGDHTLVAAGLNRLALLYRDQGKFAEAEVPGKEALEMLKRLFNHDHAEVAQTMRNLARLYADQDRLADAEPLLADALAMYKRLFKGDHPHIAVTLNDLGLLSTHQGNGAAAERLLREALAMNTRLFPGDHASVALTLNNLGLLYKEQGKLAEAESLLKAATDMFKRLCKGDHFWVSGTQTNLGAVYRARGKLAEAESLHRNSFEMNRRLQIAYARQKPEGEALTYLLHLPGAGNEFLSSVRARATAPDSTADAAHAYPMLWSSKGTVARAYEQRHQQARAATADPAITRMLAELGDARRRRAELLLAPATTDPGTRTQREADFAKFEETITRLNAALAEQLPTVGRAEKLNSAGLADLQRALPEDAAVVDYFVYRFSEFDDTRPVGRKVRLTWRYMAFVVTRARVTWVDLDTLERTNGALNAWRAAITGGKEVPAPAAAKVRELIWEKVRSAVPAAIKTLYICPDGVLCRVPWAALPGDKPGTVLLENFALATIPHPPFLLDKLWVQDPIKNRPPAGSAGALVVGGVNYDAEPARVAPARSRGGPRAEPGAGSGWGFLPNTVGELNGIAAAAERKRIATTRIEGDRATPPAVLAALPRARYAHFATHGFFADPSFRSVFRLDETDFRQSGAGERIGRAANNPLVMTGLVFAGANNPGAPGRGILTGEQLIDLDLSGLELAVLSACETGVGDVARGEGTFGLQRAFHLAGARDVVASLWKVPDVPTAALMALFYRNLWDKDLSPMEALRQAQLELYKNPGKIPELAKGFRGKFELVPGTGEPEIKPTKEGRAHPLLWAAFTLSGPGR
jgi:CHAT domain-containing protein/tetratricopeptide (TPR) repeat protein